MEVQMTPEENNIRGLEAALIARLGSAAKVTLSDTYPLAKLQPANGNWYYSAKCEQCRSIAPAIFDPSSGKNNNPFSGDGALCFECLSCGEAIVARVPDIFSYQWIDQE